MPRGWTSRTTGSDSTRTRWLSSSPGGIARPASSPAASVASVSAYRGAARSWRRTVGRSRRNQTAKVEALASALRSRCFFADALGEPLGDEAITLARDRLDEPRHLPVITQLDAQIPDVTVDDVALDE